MVRSEDSPISEDPHLAKATLPVWGSLFSWSCEKAGFLSDASNLITRTTSGRRSEPSYLPSRSEDIDLK
jgi:hypothetical protein